MESDEWFELVAKSGTVRPKLLSAFNAQFARNALASDLATKMVAERALTRWQADMWLNGKWKGFFLEHFRLEKRDMYDEERSVWVFEAKDTRNERNVVLEVDPHALSPDGKISFRVRCTPA